MTIDGTSAAGTNMQIDLIKQVFLSQTEKHQKEQAFCENGRRACLFCAMTPLLRFKQLATRICIGQCSVLLGIKMPLLVMR